MTQTSTLTDFVLAVHFENALTLNVMDLASWATSFQSEFPVVQQLPALGRLTLSSMQALPEIQINAAPELPLLMLRSAQADASLRLQSDRFALGWNRTKPPGEPDAYPGFDEMKSRWLAYVERFEQWHEARTGARSTARLVELSYSNAIPFTPGGTSSLSGTFAFLKSTGRKYNGFQTQWMEFLEPRADAARVTANAGIANLTDGQIAYAFSFMGVSGTTGRILGSETRAAIEALHARILDMYRTAIISANV